MITAPPASAISSPPAMKSVSPAAVGIRKRKTPSSEPSNEETTTTTRQQGTAGMTTKEKNKEPTASTTSSSEGSHILKLKKEAFASDGLWREMKDVPGGMRRWLKAQEAVARAEEAQPLTKRRKKKVVKTVMPTECMEMLKAYGPPRSVSDDLPDEVVSGMSERLRRYHVIRKYVDSKWADYFNALSEQYELKGYAEDEDELTDDEDDDVVKMSSLAI